MQIDMYTVLVQGGLSAVLLGTLILFYWWSDRRSTWLRWWSLPFFSVAIAALVYSQWTAEPNAVTVVLGNLALQATFGSMWMAMRVFERRRPLLWPLAAAWALWVALCSWEPFFENLAFRVVVSSIIVPTFVLLAAYELWRGRAERLPSRMPAIVVLTVTGLCFLARIPLVNVLPFPIGGLPLDPLAQSILNLMLFALAITMTILMISMTRERSESQQRQIAMTDPLTGLFNRRAFKANAERIVRRHLSGRKPLSVLMLDLDHFKAINDRYGHETGDKVLIRFADVLEKNVRAVDQLYRLGGEEFLCILANTDGRDAMGVAERICSEFEAGDVEVVGGKARATVSIGVSTSSDAGYDLEELLGQADAAVYEAKARGRNMAVLAGDVPMNPRQPRASLTGRPRL